MGVSLASLLVQETKSVIYATAIGIARAVGLPVDTWQPGDPTRSQYHVLATFLEKLEVVVVGYIGSGFLEHAKGDWLDVVAKQMFNVDVPPATTAIVDVVLTNTGARYFEIEVGDLTAKNSATGKTYTNKTAGVIASGPGTTLTITFEADEAGSAGSAQAGEIDVLVTGLTGVTCTNPAAGLGYDKQDPAITIQQCRDKIDSWSPNGPRGAYAYVARNPDLAGTNAVTRVRVYPSSDTGDVRVYLAGPSGAVAAPDRALVADAILKWATPLCITPHVFAARNRVIPVSYELWAYKSINRSVAELEDDVGKALATLMSTRPIGGDIIDPSPGALYVSVIESTIRSLYPEIFRVRILTPATESTTLDEDEVPVLGTVTASITFKDGP